MTNIELLRKHIEEYNQTLVNARVYLTMDDYEKGIIKLADGVKEFYHYVLNLNVDQISPVVYVTRTEPVLDATVDNSFRNVTLLWQKERMQLPCPRWKDVKGDTYPVSFVSPIIPRLEEMETLTFVGVGVHCVQPLEQTSGEMIKVIGKLQLGYSNERYW